MISEAFDRDLEAKGVATSWPRPITFIKASGKIERYHQSAKEKVNLVVWKSPKQLKT